MTPRVPFKTVCDAASAEARGRATPQQQQLLAQVGLDTWAAALRKLAGDVDRQLELRAARLADAQAHNDPDVDQQAADDAAWRPKALTFRRTVVERLADIDCRRATHVHQRLRRAASAVHAGAVEGAIADDHLAELAALLDLLDEIDPLPAAPGAPVERV